MALQVTWERHGSGFVAKSTRAVRRPSFGMAWSLAPRIGGRQKEEGRPPPRLRYKGPAGSRHHEMGYAEGRRGMIFLAATGGIRVAILRIMASTRRLSPSESVLLYFLISARKRISS